MALVGQVFATSRLEYQSAMSQAAQNEPRGTPDEAGLGFRFPIRLYIPAYVASVSQCNGSPPLSFSRRASPTLRPPPSAPNRRRSIGDRPCVAQRLSGLRGPGCTKKRVPGISPLRRRVRGRRGEGRPHIRPQSAPYKSKVQGLVGYFDRRKDTNMNHEIRAIAPGRSARRRPGVIAHSGPKRWKN